MSSTIKITTYFEATIDGKRISDGSTVTTNTVSIASDSFYANKVEVADAATAKVFDVAEDLTDFDFLWIVSDQTIEAELVTGNGSGSETMFVLTLKANIPLILGDDAGRRSDHTEDWGAAGTADTIDKITVKNSSGSTANVTVYTAT